VNRPNRPPALETPVRAHQTKRLYALPTQPGGPPPGHGRPSSGEREADAPCKREHYDKAFAASAKLLEAESELAATPPGRRAKLNRTIRNELARLERLTARDREMTRALAPYLRAHGGEMQSYRHFVDWCTDTLNTLNKQAKRGRLNNAERETLAALNKLTGLDERTIQYWLQNQYGARGEPGKPGRPPKTKDMNGPVSF
jgi:hypothetical protein